MNIYIIVDISLLRPLNPIGAQISQNWERSFFDLVTSHFDLGDLRFTFETPRPHRSTN